jgi:hypothetical protein
MSVYFYSNSVCVCVFFFFEHILFEQRGLALVGPMNAALKTALGISLGYMAFDSLAMLFRHSELRAALSPALFNQMLFHHVGSMTAWTHAASTSKCVLFVAYFMCTEVTNVLMNTRWFLNEHRVAGTLPSFAGFALLPLFFAVRVLPVPLVLRALVMGNYEGYTALEKLYVACVLLPLSLNCFWFALMVKAARARAL